jgi:hypothetical protein
MDMLLLHKLINLKIVLNHLLLHLHLRKLQLFVLHFHHHQQQLMYQLTSFQVALLMYQMMFEM